MKLAVSNIAWDPAEEPAVAEMLVREKVRFVEIAPTRISHAPLDLSDRDLAAYRTWWNDRGIGIVSMQALLFGRADLKVFDDETISPTVAYLEQMLRIAAAVGAETAVFGSPGNRRIEALPPSEVLRLEQQFFTSIGRAAAKLGIRFCVEPNPPRYGCNYLNTSREVSELLNRLPSTEGLGIHLDTGAMTLAGETAEALLEVRDLRHFHISEPDLAAIGSSGIDHRAFSEALRRIGYDRWISIEMRPAGGVGTNTERVREALRFAREIYRPVE